MPAHLKNITSIWSIFFLQLECAQYFWTSGEINWHLNYLLCALGQPRWHFDVYRFPHSDKVRNILLSTAEYRNIYISCVSVLLVWALRWREILRRVQRRCGIFYGFVIITHYRACGSMCAGELVLRWTAHAHSAGRTKTPSLAMPGERAAPFFPPK